MRKFIFSLKSLAMTLALVVGGSAWAQIASLPFVADFSSGDVAPFTGGSAAFVATIDDGVGDTKLIAANNGESYAQFATPYALSNGEEVTVSFQMLNGWLGGGKDNKFAILNSDGVALASISYNNNSCNINEVLIDNSMVDDFAAFNGQSSAGAKGANGYGNGKGQGFKINTAETKYNAEVTIKINSFGGISVSIVGGKNNNDVTYSRAAQPGTKLNLDKVVISNASNNGDRATGYYGLKIESKSMIKYSNDYSNEVVTWTTATGGRFTPIIQDGYLTVTQDQRNNNGTTITSTETEGKVAAGESFTMSFDVKLGASTNQTATAFNIYDAANSAAILSFAEGATYATAWTINGGTQTATVSAGGNKGIDELSWISVKVTSIAGGKTYLTLKDAEGTIIDGFDKKDIPTLSETGGLGKMNFVTSRYLANFAIDNIVVREVVESEDIPATPIYNYTVKFVDQDGNEFKDASVREEYEGVELAITDDDKATVVEGKSQYTYVSDDAAGQTAASDGSTVITVTFEKTTVANYVVNYLDGDGNVLKEATTHKNAKVGSQVNATLGEVSRMLINGVFYDQVSGNEPLTVSEDETANVINLVFAPVAGVTGYFYNNYENRAVDWTTATGGRYDPVVVDGSTIADRATTEKKPKTDPETGEPIVDPETGEPEYEDVPGLDIPFANKTYFLTVNQAQRNNNGVTNGVSSASLAVEQADFTLETKIILGTSNNQGCSFQIKNFAGDANILQLIPTAVGSTTWVVNGDAENFAVELPGTGNFGGTDNNNLTNYDWYDLKVTVYNGTTFVTIVDQNDNVILDKAQVPTLATTYGVGKMIFYTGRYNSNIAVDDVTVRSVVESEDVPAGAEFVAVKINYVDEAGTPVKPADEAKFQVGQPIVLNSAFVADFKVDAEGNVWTAESESAPVTKYIYVSDNSADVEVALDAQVNIVFRGVAPRRVALRPQYQTVGGEITTKDASGKNLSFFYDSNKAGDVLFEKDILTVYYPYYLLVDGLLYKTGNNSGGTDKIELEIEPGTGTQSKSPVTWTPATEVVPVLDEDGYPLVDPETEQPITREEQISNAVFAQETENIEGITPIKDGYTTIRMANGATGSAIGGDVLVTTLEPGTYTITTATRSGTTNFKAAGNVVATITSSGTVTTVTSEEFTVDQATPLYIEEQASTTQYSDYVLVRKTKALETYKITLNMNATEYGVVNVPASAAVGATITPVFTPAPGYQVESYEISVVDAEGAPVTVLDGSFIMPASDVTVTASAVFVPKKIYIETDLTADFDALTNWRNWTGATGYTATNFCPAVVTNAGKTVQVCEKYDGTCANTGDVLTQTVNGLTPGTYKIELYGGAAFTFGRGFGSIAFTGDLSVATSETYQAGDKIEPTVENPTGVSLQATTSEGTYGGEIPIYYATNFPDGAAVVTIDGVEVGQNGVLTIGMSKTSQSTNWHVIQLKGVTAQVLASDLLAKSVAKISGYTEDDLTPEMYSAVQEALVTYNKAYDTAEEYKTAIAAIDAVAEAALPVAELVKNTKAVEGATYSNPVETAFVVNGTFDSAIAPWITTTGAQNSALASNQQGAFTVPFWENWNPNPYTGKMYQTIKNIPNGVYTLKIAAFVNNFAGDNQASQYVYANEFKTYLTTGEPTAYEVKDVVVTDNTLEIGFEQTEAVANWAGIDNVSLLYHGATLPFEITVVPSENGSLDLPAKAGAGETVAIVANPAVGYELASVMITGVNTNIAVEVDVDEWTGEMSFTMPEDDVTVTATFQEAYVKLSDYAVTVDPTFVHDPEFGDEIVATITYNSEIVGSYAESFALNAQFDYEVKDAEGNVVTTGTKNPLNVSDNTVTAYIDGLAENTTYTINITGVEVTDFDLATFESVVVFKEVVGLDGNPLATATFTTVKPFIAELNVERYVGQGYNATVAEVDFSAAEEYLGVNGITTDMLRIVNPDGTTISDYAPYDGWFDGDGKAETWGANTKINVKFFEALTDGKYTICDMNGADVVDATYTVRWAIEANDKVAFFNINVKFVEQPTVAPEIATEVDVPVLLKSGTAYEAATAAFNVLDVTGPLNLDAISDAEQYIVNVTDGSFVANSTDGWRDANGDAATWGSGAGMVCVKIGDPASGIIDYLGAIDDSYEDGATYTAKWGFVNKESNTAVILNINITFVTDPTGIDATPAADGVKPDGKYFENGKIVIYKNGNKYDASGAPMNK
jgi:hypothetical protein